MEETNHRSDPGFATLLRRLSATGLGALQNRGELLAVEWQLERARRVQFLMAAFLCLFLAVMGLSLITGIVLALVSAELRLYLAGAFALLYLAGALGAGLRLRRLLRQTPFAESLNQLKQDRIWLESTK